MCWLRRAVSAYRSGDSHLACWLRLMRCRGTIFAAGRQAIRALALGMVAIWLRDQAIEMRMVTPSAMMTSALTASSIMALRNSSASAVCP